jgi:hypothetical protein
VCDDLFQKTWINAGEAEQNVEDFKVMLIGLKKNEDRGTLIY